MKYTRQRVAAAGLADRVTVLCEDYRVLQGSFDKLVSIEMIEAVGHQYFDTYFRVCSGAAQNARHDALAGDRHPGPALRCLPAFGGLHSTLHLSRRLPPFAGGHLPFAGPRDPSARSYPSGGHHRPLRRNPGTLAAPVPANLDHVRGLGFSEEFICTWGFYFCYCEGGFRERMIGDVQMLLTKPRARRRGISGLTRPTRDSRQAASCSPDATSLPSNPGTCRTAPAALPRTEAVYSHRMPSFSLNVAEGK